ncbi:MAG: FkbM family methyltransferase [Candidatus Omnitrophota bacterium]
MEIATVVYKQYLASRKGNRRKIWSFVRKVLIKTRGDPTCSLLIHGRRLKLPLSHSLPDYLKQYRFYDQLPQRISVYIHQAQGRLNCIDVGANIGDTLACFYKDDTDIFLAIEPNPKFNKLLVENWGGNKNVTVVSDVCSSISEEGTFIIQEKKGTASIVQTENGITLNRKSLDEIVDDHSFARNANVLKIDTDGHDFEVIAGAKRLLSRNLPVVLFECYDSENTNYVEDCLRTLKLLKQIGYNYFLLYSNFGNLMGRYSLSDLTPFRNLLFFQLTSDFCYFDILIMKDEDLFPFYKAEINFFVDKMSNKSLQRTAIAFAVTPQ